MAVLVCKPAPAISGRRDEPAWAPRSGWRWASPPNWRWLLPCSPCLRQRVSWC